jgi:O-antigen/teichoic acid export membrane protein
MPTTQAQTGRRPSLKRNALSNFGALAVNVVVGFFLTPAMLNYLGEKRLGIWTLASSLVGYFGLLEFGVGSAVFRYVPLFHGKGDRHRLSSVVSTSLAFYTGLSLLVVLCTQVLAYPIARFFGGGPEVAGLLRIVGLATALSFPAIVLNTTTAGYENFMASNFIAVFVNLFRGGLLFGCMLAGFGLTAMGSALLLSSLASLCGNFIAFRRTCTDVTLSPKAVRWQELKMLLSFGAVILVVSVANSLATESPKQIVAKTVSLDALGLFGIPLLLISYYRMLIITLTKVFSPRFSFLAGRAEVEGPQQTVAGSDSLQASSLPRIAKFMRGCERLMLTLKQALAPDFSYLTGRAEGEEMRRLFIQGSRYMTMLAGGVALLLWMAGPAFLLLWTKRQAILQTVPSLSIMVAGTFVFLSLRLAGDLLFGLGCQVQIAVLELAEAVGIVGLAIPLSMKFGMLGAGVGLAVPPLLVRGALQTRFVSRALGLGFAEYYLKCVLRSWLVVAVVLALGQGFGLPQLIKGWPTLFLFSAVVMLLYAGGVFILVLDGPERKQILEEARRRLAQLARVRVA